MLTRNGWKILFAAQPAGLDLMLLAVGVTASFVAGTILPTQTVLSGHMVDDLGRACTGPSSEAFHSVSQYQIRSAILLAAINLVVIFVSLVSWSIFGERLVQRIQFQYLRALLEQDADFFDRVPAHEVAVGLNADLEAIRAGVDERLGTCISMAAYVVSACAISYWQAPTLSMTMTAVLPLYYVLLKSGPEHVAKITKAVDDFTNSALAMAGECICNLPVIQAFDASAKVERHFGSKLHHQAVASRRKGIACALQSALLCLTLSAAKALAIWQGSKEMAEGKLISIGGIQNVIAFVSAIQMVFSNLVPFSNNFSAAQASYEKLGTVMAKKPKIEGMATGDGVELSDTDARGDVILDTVSFAYPNRPSSVVLNQCSLNLPAGKKTALVGISGTGKSTIANLLCRLYDPQQGKIWLNGRDLREYKVRSLRSHIAIAESKPVLFAKSVFENVAYGLAGTAELGSAREELQSVVARVCLGQSWSEACQGSRPLRELVERVKRALRQAEAYGFVSELKHGMATEMTHASRLSSGQAQRIALARALVRDSAILVLDESCSALDMHTASIIQSNILRSFANRTVILITHRLNSIRDFDNIVVMGDGSVSEQGNYEDLIGRGGAFAHMVHLQSTKSGNEPVPSKDPEVPHSNLDQEEQPRQPQSFAGVGHESDDGPKVVSVCQTSAVGRTIAYLCRQARSHIALLVVGLCTTVFAAMLGVFDALSLASSSRDIHVNCTTSREQLVQAGRTYAYSFMAVGLVSSLIELVRSYAVDMMSASVSNRSRVLGLRLLLRKSITWHQAQTPGSLLSLLRGAATMLGQVTESLLGTLLENTLCFVVHALLAYFAAWRIALIMLLLIPAVGIMRNLELKVTSNYWRLHYRGCAASLDVAKQSIDGIHTVLRFGLQDEMLDCFRTALKIPRRTVVYRVIGGNFLRAIPAGISPLTNVLVACWALKQVSDGHYDLEQLFTALTSIRIAEQAFVQLSSATAAVERDSNYVIKLIDLVAQLPRGEQIRSSCPCNVKASSGDTKSLYKFSSGTTSIAANDPSSEKGHLHAPEIHLRAVRFAYPCFPHKEILKDLSITFPSGTLCAIVGASGSGKSTIFKLVEKLYSPTNGNVIVAGTDLGDMDESNTAFRTSMALVPQEDMIFDESVLYNIDLGSRPGVEQVSMHELTDALRGAGLQHIIQGLPRGYMTRCGAGGRHFSSGQRRRLAIARALIRQATLLLLDEPASTLDIISEVGLYDILERLKGRTTILVITHNLTLLERADMVVLIENGRCLERGTHAELLRRSESYRKNLHYPTTAIACSAMSGRQREG